jgi:ribonuclease P/MRP protein subunit POP5
MKPLLPSLKEKKRYVVFGILADTTVRDSDAYSAIKESMHQFVGDKGMAMAGVQFIHEKWNSQKQRGIIRVTHTSVDDLRASFPFITTINHNKVVVYSVGVSGILAKAEKKWLAG